MDRLTSVNIIEHADGTNHEQVYCFGHLWGPAFFKKGTKDYEEYLAIVKRLAEYEDLEEQGKLLKPPCAVGDFALFCNGDIRPVIYVTMSNVHEGIIVGCQNGIHISMNLHYGSWCKGFFKTCEEAKSALKELEDKKA